MRNLQFWLFVLASLSAGPPQAADWTEAMGADRGHARMAAMRSFIDAKLALLEKSAKEQMPWDARNGILDSSARYAEAEDSVFVDSKTLGLVRMRFALRLDARKLLRRIEGTALCRECCRKPVILAAQGKGAPADADPASTITVARVQPAPAGLSLDSASRAGADYYLVQEWRVGAGVKSSFYGMVRNSVTVGVALELFDAFTRSRVSAWDSAISMSGLDPLQAEAHAKGRLARLAGLRLSRAIDSAWAGQCFATQPAIIRLSTRDRAYPEWLDGLMKVGGVVQARARFWGNGEGVWDLSFQGPFASLIDGIRRSLPVDLLKIEANQIYLAVSLGKVRTGAAAGAHRGLELSESVFPPLFGALQQSYGSRPYGSLELMNPQAKPLNRIRVTVGLDAFQGRLYDTLIPALGPGDKVRLPVSLSFPPGTLESVSAGFRTFARVGLRPEGASASSEFQIPVWIHSRNSLSWDDPRAVCAYIDPNDPVIREFVRRSGNGSRRGALFTAARLYEALAMHGMRYMPDPKSRIGLQGEVDEIQFPRESLFLKTGDCDDLSVLYASLLQAAGMETRILVFPKHVLVMAAMDVPVAHSGRLSPEPSRVVSHEGRTWIGVETTMLGKAPFLLAWEAAAAAMGSESPAGMVTHVVNPMEGWMSYPFANPPPINVVFKPDTAGLDRKMDEFISAWTTANSQAATRRAEGEACAKGLAEGIALWGDRVRLKRRLSGAVCRGDAASGRISNLGNLEAMDDRWEAAASRYRQAAALDPGAPGIGLNLAVAAAMAGEPDSTRERILQAWSRDASAGALLRELGWPLGEGEDIKSEGRDSIRSGSAADRQKAIADLIRQVRDEFEKKKAKDRPDSSRIAKEVHPVGEERPGLPVPSDAEAMLWWY